jgi:microcystin-dependent protein
MSNYYTLITDIGQQKLATAVANNTTVELVNFAVGDGDYIPATTQIALVNEQYRTTINVKKVDPTNLNNAVFECLIPENVGGWYIREIGLFDSAGDLFAIGKYPPTYKPTVVDGALLKQFTINLILAVGNSDTVTLSTPATGIASLTYVDNDEKATVLETQDGIIDNKYITPLTLQQKSATLTELVASNDKRFISPSLLQQFLTGDTGNNTQYYPHWLINTLLPSISSYRFMGYFDASQGTLLPSNSPIKGQAWQVDVPGYFTVSGNAYRVLIGDILWFGGTNWQVNNPLYHGMFRNVNGVQPSNTYTFQRDDLSSRLNLYPATNIAAVVFPNPETLINDSIYGLVFPGKNLVAMKTEIVLPRNLTLIFTSGDNSTKTMVNTSEHIVVWSDGWSWFVREDGNFGDNVKYHLPPGVIAYFPGTSAPPGWLTCNGSLLSRTSYPNLWAAAQSSGGLTDDSSWMSNNFGLFSTGDTSTNFRLPMLLGEFIRGWDAGRGIDAGRTLGRLQAQDIQSHNHPTNWLLSNESGTPNGSLATGTSTYEGVYFTGSTNFTGGTETRPRNMALLPIIKY